MELKNAVFYNILIDRFSRGKDLDEKGWTCNGPEFCGGNLKGITERLDYLKELGVDIILPTPFNKGIEYHGYHTTDLLSIDPRFGTLDDLKNFTAEAHKRDMKVIMDWTVNHVSWKHPYFVEAMRDKNSEYRKWFHFYKFSNSYKSFLDVVALPKLNLEHPPVKGYIFEATKFWLKQGIDGMRLDHVIGISHEFWKEFREMAKKESPNAILVGEAVKNRIRWIELPTLKMKFKYLAYFLSLFRFNHNEILIHHYMKHFDAMLDFRFRDIVVSQISKKKSPNWVLAKLLIKLHYGFYPKNYPLISIIDNPDHNRLIFECGHDWDRVKQIVRLQLGQDKPVSIFYGSEAGISQDVAKTKVEYSDIDIRRPMPWKEIDEGMFNFYRGLILKRKENLSA